MTAAVATSGARRESLSWHTAGQPVPEAHGPRAGAIAERLDALAATFRDHVAGATAALALHVQDDAELAGLSESERVRAQQRAADRQLPGYLLTVDAPSYAAAMRQLEHRPLRKSLFEARHTRASERDPNAARFDNTATYKEMLALRHELSQLLGRRNYAELAMARSALADPDAAEGFLLSTHQVLRPRAQAALDALWAFAKDKGVPRGFSHWDLTFYAAWRAREELGVDAARLRAHLTLPTVCAGLWPLCESVLGLRVQAPPEAVPTAAPTRLRVARGDRPLGELHLHAFAPPGELDQPSVAFGPEANGLPTVELRWGLRPSLSDAPVSLSPAELDTVLRTVGSALALLGAAEPPVANRGGVPAASAHAAIVGAYLAQYANHYPSLSGLARDAESGAPLSRALFDGMQQARAQLRPIHASQDLEFALFDLRLHRDFVPVGNDTQLRDQVMDTFIQVRREQSILPKPYWTRLANVSLPLFVRGEAARMWQRIWADRVAAVLFAAAGSGDGDGDRSRVAAALWAVPGEGALDEALGAVLGQPIALGG